jgi:hypothetical protein
LEEWPWVERALVAMPDLSPQEHRVIHCLAASSNLAGIARSLDILRADKLVGRAYSKLGLSELAQRSGYLRQNAIVIKACQIYGLGAPTAGLRPSTLA